MMQQKLLQTNGTNGNKTISKNLNNMFNYKEEQTMKQKLNLRIRIKDGKTYVSQNYGDWIVNNWDDLTDDMQLILNVLCRMEEFDVTIDAKRE